MESRQVFKLVVRSGRRASRDGAADTSPGADSADPPASGDASVPQDLEHHELDELLLQEIRSASEMLMQASAALHAASTVVLEAAAIIRDQREER